MNYISDKKVNDSEIDLVVLIKKLFINKKIIIKTSFVSFIFGLIIAISQPNQFTSTTTFIPQLSSEVKTGGSSLSSLASLAGINIGGFEGSSVFPPSLYPQVVNSFPFKLELLSSNIELNNKKLTVRQYFSENESSFDFIGTLKKYTLGLPSLISKSLRTADSGNSRSGIYSVSEEDQELFNKLSQKSSLSINESKGFITMSYTDKNKSVAAQITKIAQTLLQQKIIKFKVQSSKEILDYTQNQYNDKKIIFQKIQDERAIFVDQNINISSSLYQNKLSRIENELSVAQSIVMQLASQVEQAKLQVSKDTPVFITIKPVNIPYERSSPKRKLIVFTYIFIGFILSCTYIFAKEPVLKFFNSVKS